MAPIRFGSVSASIMVVVVKRSPIIRMSRVVVVDDNGDGWCIMMGIFLDMDEWKVDDDG